MIMWVYLSSKDWTILREKNFYTQVKKDIKIVINNIKVCVIRHEADYNVRQLLSSFLICLKKYLVSYVSNSVYNESNMIKR